LGGVWGGGVGVGVTADDVRGCYDPVWPCFRGCYDPILPRFSFLFSKLYYFEFQNNKFRSSRIRNNPPLSIFLFCLVFLGIVHKVECRKFELNQQCFQTFQSFRKKAKKIIKVSYKISRRNGVNTCGSWMCKLSFS